MSDNFSLEDTITMRVSNPLLYCRPVDHFTNYRPANSTARNDPAMNSTDVLL